jgi:DNA-binding protein HU-beta
MFNGISIGIGRLIGRNLAKPGENMTKTELVAVLAKETGLAQTQAKEVLETFLAKTVKALKKDSRFALAGLGVFTVVKRAKRKGRNPRTGEPVNIKAHKAVKFKPAKTLKDAIA